MPRRRDGRSTSYTPAGSAGKVVLAFLLGVAATIGAGYLYLHSTPHPTRTPAPVALERQATSPAKLLPPAHPPAPNPPFGTSEDVFEAGAHTYAARCASCHGTPQHDASSTPAAPQLWRKARLELATRSPGDLYNQTTLGLPAKGMPAYARVLTSTQIWQLALLLKNADGDLPDPVVNILNAPPRR